MYKFEGTVYKIEDTQQITEKFSKRTIVLDDGHEDYPQLVSFEFVNDKTDLLDPYSEGDLVTVSFSLRGREWTNEKTGEIRYFNTLNAFKIEGEGGTEKPQKVEEPVKVEEEGSDDLPF